MEDIREYYANLSFSEKLAFSREVYTNPILDKIGHYVQFLCWDGYLTVSEKYCVRESDNEYGVYLWRHAWGEPFYVGSGKGDRWKNKSPRCDDFYLHLDQGDAVVYKILDGVDPKTARLYEKYVSVNLGRAGYVLANGDNNYEYATDLSQQRMIEKCDKLVGLGLTARVENAVLGIIGDDPECDYRITDEFIMRHGTDYFSRNYLSGRRKYCCDRA